MARNPGTRVGRPPAIRSTVAVKPIKGIAPAPMDNFDRAIPAKAFNRGGSVGGFKTMPRHHDDPSFCAGGPTRRK